ncbi:MAG: DUF58 domain-containing protein [Phycisphaerae bacterium]|nr:DUF58 domain-containing protein [Phycisphaerae bacterium]
MTLLDPETINQAEALGLQARTIVEGFMSGNHASPFRGFSIEFSQHREYTAGDDTRHLDWKVLGRTDRYYIKQYEQETNYVAHVLVDGSESMSFKSAKVPLSKFDYARIMSACLCYLILRQRDAVALNLFDGEVRVHIPRTGNLASVHPIMSSLAAFQPVRGTNIPAVLHQIAHTQRRRGIVLLISDLLDHEDAILDGMRHLRFVGHEVIVFHTLDHQELDFNFAGAVEFEGLEAAGKITARPFAIRASYLRQMQQFRDRLREGCERDNAHYVLVDTSHPLHEVLSGYLAFRHRIHR